MREDLTDITFLLDRTGSMADIANDVVGGVNTFIEQQQSAANDATFALIQFDSIDHHEVIHDATPIRDVPKMQSGDFVPRSSTPLFDALGAAITKTGERLSAMDDQDRPSKVVFVVFTDGLENASKEYSGDRVLEMVKHQRESYNWEFIFLGADIDAFAQGGAVGIAVAFTADVDRENIQSALDVTSKKLASYRSSGDTARLAYSKADRDKMSSKRRK